MSLKIEAAVVTKKRDNEEFNTDSVNINGKVLPREVILNGYKGAGVIDNNGYFVLNSSFVEGYSDASVASFEDFAIRFNKKGVKSNSVINEYFRNTVTALNSLNHSSNEISIGIAYCENTNVVLARSGDTSLYSYSNGILKKISPENSMHDDSKSNYGCYTINEVCVDDIFLLVSPGAAASLTDKDITDICRVSDGSVKKIVNITSRVAEAKPTNGGIGIIAIKILDIASDIEEDTVDEIFVPVSVDNSDIQEQKEPEIDEPAPELPSKHEEVVGGFVPSFEFESNSIENDLSVDILSCSDENSIDKTNKINSDNDYDNESNHKSNKLILIGLIVGSILIIAGVLIGVAKFTDLYKGTEEITTDIESITEPEITTEEETTEETTIEETTEETTAETTTTVRTTYYYRYTQSATSAPTTAAPTTSTPTTSEPTTSAPTTVETTTSASKTTEAENSTVEDDFEEETDIEEEAEFEEDTDLEAEFEEVTDVEAYTDEETYTDEESDTDEEAVTDEEADTDVNTEDKETETAESSSKSKSSK